MSDVGGWLSGENRFRCFQRTKEGVVSFLRPRRPLYSVRRILCEVLILWWILCLISWIIRRHMELEEVDNVNLQQSR